MASGCIYFFYTYPLKLVFTHTFFCFSLYLFCAAYSSAVGAFEASVRRPALKSLMFSFASTFLLFVYAGNAISNYYWKANVNLNLIGRMLVHYYHLYPIFTRLVVITPPVVVCIIVLMLYRKLFQSVLDKENNPFMSVFIYLSLSAIIFVQLSVFNVDRAQKDVNEYFVGEMFVDLISEYTDPHQDYVNDAGGIRDNVVQSLGYVPQHSENIDRSKKNIVLVIVDCLRADHLHSYGYHRNTTPFINDLIKENSSQQVEHAFS